MYTIRKTIEVSGSHSLTLGHESPCERLHGHNWMITVECQAKTLDDDGMVVDFSLIKAAVKDRLDHRHLNDVVPFNPTAENLAKWIVDNVPHCVSATVEETRGNSATYVRD